MTLSIDPLVVQVKTRINFHRGNPSISHATLGATPHASRAFSSFEYCVTMFDVASKMSFPVSTAFIRNKRGEKRKRRKEKEKGKGIIKTERIFPSRNDARVQKFSFWLKRSIMKTLPVLCFSSVIEETVYTGSDETNFCDTDKIQRDERCTGREKEKRKKLEESRSRNTKRCFFLFFFFYSLAS